MCLGRRHFVVFMTFLGYLICIGSVSVFSVVITHVIEKHGNKSEETCDNSKGLDLSQPWDQSFVFYFQTVYYIGFIITQLPGGILSAKFSPRRVCGIATMGTSLLSIGMWFCIRWDYYAVFAVRFLQGLVEGPLIPAFNGVISAWALKSELSVMITLAFSGVYISAAVADSVTGAIICPYGWGTALFVYGGAGAVWSVVWLCCVYDSPVACLDFLSDHERALYLSEEHSISDRTRPPFSSIPWKKILTSLPLSAIFVAAFCRNWVFALLLTQLPKYYKDVFEMEPHEYGLWLALPHVIMTCFVISGGFTVDFIIRKRWLSKTAARKTAQTIGFGFESSCLLALGLIPHLGKTEAVIILCVGVGLSGPAISGYQVNPLDLAPQYAAVLTGFVRLGTIGSVLSTVIAAKFTEFSHEVSDWQKLFIIAGSLHLFGVVYYLIFASGNRQSWAEYVTPERNIQVYDDVSVGIRSQYPDVENERRPILLQQQEDLLTRSMYVEKIPDDSADSYEAPRWFTMTL